MNKQLQKFARDTLRDGLAQLPESDTEMFLCMYSPKNLSANINDVIEKMPTEKLDWAMQQVQRSLEEEA